MDGPQHGWPENTRTLWYCQSIKATLTWCWRLLQGPKSARLFALLFQSSFKTLLESYFCPKWPHTAAAAAVTCVINWDHAREQENGAQDIIIINLCCRCGLDTLDYMRQISVTIHCATWQSIVHSICCLTAGRCVWFCHLIGSRGPDNTSGGN